MPAAAPFQTGGRQFFPPLFNQIFIFPCPFLLKSHGILGVQTGKEDSPCSLCLPWLLRLTGIVLLVKGLLDRPFQPENLLPAVGAFAASWLLGLLF